MRTKKGTKQAVGSLSFDHEKVSKQADHNHTKNILTSNTTQPGTRDMQYSDSDDSKTDHQLALSAAPKSLL